MSRKIIKFIISIGLLLVLIYVAEMPSVFSKIKVIDISYILGCVAILSFAQLLSSVRWQKILKADGVEISLSYLFSSYMIGMFANNFMPTSIGGDIVKTYDIYRITKNMTLSFLSVFLERFTGLIILLILSWLGVSIAWQSASADTLGIWIVVNALCIIVVLCFVNKATADRMQTYLDTSRMFRKIQGLGGAFRAVRSFTRKKVLLAKLLLISIPIQLITVTIYYILSQSIGLNISFVFLLFTVPLITILSLLPISLGGLGVRESTTVLMFSIDGISPESALALSLVYTGVVYITGLLGAISLIMRQASLREYYDLSKKYGQNRL